MAKKVKRRARKRVVSRPLRKTLGGLKLGKTLQRDRADFLKTIADAPRPPLPTFCQWDIDQAKRRAAEEARARDAYAVIQGLLANVPADAQGMVSLGLSVAQARAVAAVLGRTL